MGMKQGQYRKLFEGIKQCMVCGFSEAPGESKLHNICHNRYVKAKSDYGDNVLSYKELLETEERIEAMLHNENLKSMCSDDTVSDYILNRLCTIQYTKSVKFWDYFKPHPKFDDYVALLWNTPAFIKYISGILSEEVVNKKIAEYRANRRMRETDIFKNEFVFMNICEVEYDNKTTKKGIRDLSHLDNILIADDEEEVEIEAEADVENLDEDIDDTADFFKALLTNIAK